MEYTSLDVPIVNPGTLDTYNNPYYAPDSEMTPSTAVAFDPCRELLWVGGINGNISSYFLPSMQRYCAFNPPVADNPVLQILPFYRGILNVTATSLSIHTIGGVPKYTIGTPQEDIFFTCAAFNEICMETIANRVAFPEYVTVGCSNENAIYCYSLSYPENPVRRFPLGSSATSIACCGGSERLMVVGTDDGQLSCIDASLRSNKVNRFISNDYNGKILSLDLKDHLVAACGMHGVSINPYDKNAPVHYYPDTFVNIYDVRMMSRIFQMPLPTSRLAEDGSTVSMVGTPAYVKFFRSNNGVIRLAAADMSANVFFYDMMYSTYVPSGNVYLDNMPIDIQLCAMDLSSSGEVLAFALSDGSVHTRTVNYYESSDAPKVNVISADTNDEISSIPMPEEISPALLSTRTFSEQRFSSFFPKMNKRSGYGRHGGTRSIKTIDFSPLPRRALHPDFQKKIQSSGGVQYVRHPYNVPLNSFIYSDLFKEMYISGDARDRRNSPNRSSMSPEMCATEEESKKDELPFNYSHHTIHFHGKGGIDMVGNLQNSSSIVPGMENLSPNSYTNCVLQLLFPVTEIRDEICSHFCTEHYCILCELHFLYLNMLRLGDLHESITSGKAEVPEGSFLMPFICQTNNLTRIFGQIPEITAFDLMQHQHQNPLTSLLRRNEKFYRFLVLQLLQKSGLDSNLISIPVCRIRACERGHRSSNQCSVTAIEMSYKSDEPKTFSETLQISIENTNHTKGWCEECKAYVNMTQECHCESLLKNRYLTIQCNLHTLTESENSSATTALDRKMQLYWRNHQWIPKRFTMKFSENSKMVISENRDIGSIQPSDGEEVTYELVALISCINNIETKSSHFVLHLSSQNLDYPSAGVTTEDWILINDYYIFPTTFEDAIDFISDWKYPSILFYKKVETEKHQSTIRPLNLLQANLSAKLFPSEDLPQKGDYVAMDAEFVNVDMEESSLLHDGTRIILKESRQSLARVSVLWKRTSGRLDTIMDDYIIQTEPVTDYLTRFSGLKEDDLNPHRSTHHLIPLKTAYLKLLYLVEKGCIFVGHGLRNDFRIINLVVPFHQIVDTVELYSIPNQRKISLRFLAYYLLEKDIQAKTHDSIEDAETSYDLYMKYKELTEQKKFTTVLDDIYRDGRFCHWKTIDLLRKE